MRFAPAAPAKAPLGMAWAGKAAPRSTTKKPTTPATTATMVATSHALTMNPENISPPVWSQLGVLPVAPDGR